MEFYTFRSRPHHTVQWLSVVKVTGSDWMALRNEVYNLFVLFSYCCRWFGSLVFQNRTIIFKILSNKPTQNFNHSTL